MVDLTICTDYIKNIDTFITASKSADCCPLECEGMSAKLEAVCIYVSGCGSVKDTKLNVTKLSIELMCRNPFVYW